MVESQKLLQTNSSLYRLSFNGCSPVDVTFFRVHNMFYPPGCLWPQAINTLTHIYIYNSLIYKLPFAAPIKRMKNIKSRNCLSKLLIKLFGFPTLSQIFFCKKTPQRPSNGRVEKTCLAGVFLSPGNSHFWGSGFLKKGQKTAENISQYKNYSG